MTNAILVPMVNESTLRENVEKVLDESNYDDLLINLESGRGIEFANFETDVILYNIVKIDKEIYITRLENEISHDIEDKGEIYITFSRPNRKNIDDYIDEIKQIFGTLDSGIENISSMELQDLS